MKKPPAKIKVKAKKFDDDTVRVELADVPPHVVYLKGKHEKFRSSGKKIAEKKKGETKIKEEEKKSEVSTEVKEKEEAAKEESMKLAKDAAKESKHVSRVKEPTYHRTALKK
jgi:hypothetical protein